MAGGMSHGVDKALELLRYLPRVSLNNLRPNPNSFRKKFRARGQYRGDKYGAGNKGGGQRQNFMRIGYETSSSPFYLKIPMEKNYYQGHHLKRQYPPLSLKQLQMLIDLGRIDPSQPIDLATICNTKLYKISVVEKHFGVHLTDEGADSFTAKVNIEVQHAKEPVIAAIERNGGVITTAYYDTNSLFALTDPLRFFKKGVPIPKRSLPPEDAAEYYTDPKSRGYLADPDKIAEERFALAQKYGYELPDISKDSLFEMLTMRKDARQVFFGLQPGWVINLKDKVILKPTDEDLLEFYSS